MLGFSGAGTKNTGKPCFRVRLVERSPWRFVVPVVCPVAELGVRIAIGSRGVEIGGVLRELPRGVGGGAPGGPLWVGPCYAGRVGLAVGRW